MGNCPSGYVQNGPFECVYDCATETGFFNTLVGGVPSCAADVDPTQTFRLTSVPVVPFRPGTQTPQTLDDIQTSNPDIVAKYATETTRVKGEVAIVNGKVDRTKQVSAAFKRLQDAENARDQAPEAYQKARADYYTLVKGDSWLQEEKDRVARAEVDPIVQKYTNEYVSLTGQLNNQARAYDTMSSIKDKVFRVKDDLNYSADLLVGQVDKIKAQIALDRRKREEGEAEPGWVEWVDLALNILLVLALLAAAWFIFKKLRAPKAPGAAPAPAFTEAASPP